MIEINQRMPIKKSRKGPMAFLAFVLIVGIIFFYLLFFYSGLELQQTINEKDDRELVLINNSPLVVENIEVFAGLVTGKQLIQIIPELKANERKTIVLTGIEQPIIILIIESPFQKTIQQQIDLRAFQNIDIASKIIAPRTAFQGEDLNVSLQLCNNGSTLKDVRIEQKHETGFFLQKENTQLIDILTKTCETIDYTFTALKQGTTTIFFNIKVLDSMKTLTQEIEVK